MPLNNPVPFREALQSRDVKRVLPTTLSSAELAQLPVAIRERAMFSARTTNEHYLEEIAKRVRKILNPETKIRGEDDPHGRAGEAFTDGMDFATARTELKGILREIGYAPDPDEAGTLKDLSSDARLNLVLETNVEMAQGYGYWAQGQDAELLELYPAQELFRAEDREEPRDWPTIWRNAAQTVGDRGAMASLAHGRMVARKDSPIWVEISDFGQPYPPFKFNSGMDVMDVDREEAIALGVIEESTIVQPQSRGFELKNRLANSARDGVWRTINGTPVFIEDGQSVEDAVKEKFGDKASGVKGGGMKTAKELQPVADKAMKDLDDAVGAFASKEIDRDEFEARINGVVKQFNAQSDNEITAHMFVDFSGAYSDSESIYVQYEVSENKEGEEIIGTPSKVRLSRHRQSR